MSPSLSINMQGQLVFGEFMLQRLLSDGPAGAVWRALEVKIGRIVRLHFVPESVMINDAALKRLKRHFTAIQKLRHPHIVPTERFVEQSENGAFFVSRFVEGPLLDEYAAQWVQAEGKFPFNLIFDVLRPVATALDEAKTQNIVHRSLTPHLIVVSQTEGIQIYDFDLHGIIQESLPQDSSNDDLENIRYLAPEQLLTHKAGALSDQYAFAMMIAELLANKILYPVNSAEEFRTFILTANPPILPNYPDCVNASLQRALHRDPTVRFPSCIHLLDGLAGLIPVAFPTVYTVPVQAEKIQEEKSTITTIPVKILDDIYAVTTPPPSESIAMESNISIPTQTSNEPATVAPQENIVPFHKIAAAARSATAEKVVKKIRNERRIQHLFRLWNLLLLIGVLVAAYISRDHIALVWKQRVQGDGPVEMVLEQNENFQNENLQNEKKPDKTKSRSTVIRTRRTRKPKEEDFNDVGGSAFRNVDNSDKSDEVRFLGTSGNGKKIIFVVDVSSAMGNGENTSWGHIQKELVFSFKDLNPSQSFQVIYFNETSAILPNGDNADPSDPWIPVSSETLKNSYNFLKTVSCSGLGNPQNALEKALLIKPDVVFFISDQRSTALTLREIDNLRQIAGSIPINGVEIGEGTEPKRKSPIQTLAQACHGEYKWIDGNIHGLKR